ncbi:hypothetical protein [Nostoc sp. C052]|uniref:hypothetical protein n=1 Tax=Nostoc sp. C052 TaxID=2576902 RepID=UPI0015C4019B|nr:hypothetical protein [Nostoc sp. C052]
MGLSSSRLLQMETAASSPATPQPHHPACTPHRPTSQSQSSAALPTQTKQLHET